MPEWLKDYWPMIAFVLTVAGVPMFSAWVRSGLVTRADFDAEGKAKDAALAAEVASRVAADHQLGQLLEAVTRRLDRIETNMSHLPDQAHAQRMEISLAELRGQIAVLNERMMPVAGIADRLQEFLLERAK